MLIVFVAFMVGFMVTAPKPVPPGLIGTPAVKEWPRAKEVMHQQHPRI